MHQFAYRRSPDQDRSTPQRHEVIVVGAGPVGLCLAIDLAQRGRRVLLLDDSDRVGEGSRAICFAKRTLEIFDRLGVGEPMVERGVTWHRGRVFLGERPLYDFDLLPEAGHKRPAFINLPQFDVEALLNRRAASLPGLDLRWRNRVAALAPRDDGVRLTVDTPGGPYALDCDWLVACDGARSALRGMLDLDFAGESFEERFLIADVTMRADFPSERWFWFDPPFNEGGSALLHKQPDGVWRIDLQLGREADPAIERAPERVRPRIERMLGHADFGLEWVSVYSFQCRRLDRFVHGRVVFAGDAAHQVSPFGARGANSGVQDADNLGWKLAAILSGEAPASLIESYDIERVQAAEENIAHSTRSTDFIAPRAGPERALRDAALALARRAPFARRMVNSGRLSTPTAYDSALSTRDEEAWDGGVPPGGAFADAPLARAGAEPSWLSDALSPSFTLIALDDGALSAAPEGIALLPISLEGSLASRTGLGDVEGHVARRYALRPGGGVLVRPDGHVAARFAHITPERVERAHRRARGLT